MSHINKLPTHRCPCGKIAGYEVINNRSACIGYYCKKCAERRLAEFNRDVAERIKNGGQP